MEKLIDYYLEKSNSHKKQEFNHFVSSEGKINDVEYHIEMKKKYYPDKVHKGPLSITLGLNAK